MGHMMIATGHPKKLEIKVNYPFEGEPKKCYIYIKAENGDVTVIDCEDTAVLVALRDALQQVMPELFGLPLSPEDMAYVPPTPAELES